MDIHTTSQLRNHEVPKQSSWLSNPETINTCTIIKWYVSLHTQLNVEVAYERGCAYHLTIMQSQIEIHSVFDSKLLQWKSMSPNWPIKFWSYWFTLLYFLVACATNEPAENYFRSNYYHVYLDHYTTTSGTMFNHAFRMYMYQFTSAHS